MDVKPLLEDLNAALIAFEQDDYQNMNIFANRIMSDAAILPDNKFLIFGFLLKDLAIEMMQLAAMKEPSAIATAKAHASMFVSKVKEHCARDGFAEDEIWDQFVVLSENIRKFHLTPAEEKAYTNNEDFTHEIARRLLDYLQKERGSLLDRKNLFLKGILNELGRTYRVHGARKTEIFLLSLLSALDRFYDYVFYECESPDGSVTQEKIKEIVFPHIDQILQVFVTDSDKTAKVDGLLCELIIKWRLAFIRNMELQVQRVLRVPVEKGVRLPEETKKRISEAVTKALEVKEKTKR